MKKVTMQDIAAETGLSRNTVAKALNGGLVSPQTKQAVVEKAWQMGYAKLDENLLEEVRTALHRADTGTILVLCSQAQSVFWTRILSGVGNAVNDEGYRMQLHVVDDGDRDGEETVRMISNDVKGILFLGVFPVRFVKGISRAKLPATFFDSPVNAGEYMKLGDVVTMEGFYSTGILTDYVIRKKGCTKLAYIGFAEGSCMIEARYLGFLKSCRQNHIRPDEELQYTRPSNNRSFDDAMVGEIVDSMPYMPEAVICEDDDVAMQVALAVSRKDPKAVRNLVITGFNNTLEPDFFKKDIITVDVRIEEMGRRLVKSLTDRITCPTMDQSFTTIAVYPRLG